MSSAFAARVVAASTMVLASACVASRPTGQPPAPPEVAEPAAAGAASASAAGYGVIAYREVGPAAAVFVLEHASCRVPPTLPAGRDVLLERDVARCRVRAWRGPVTLELRDVSGRWHAIEPTPLADREGRLELRYAELDRQLARAGADGLDRHVALRVGRGGWAGTYDLARLRRLQADLHAQWVERGRGAPGLFAVRHPDHPRAAVVGELAIEARLARQESDFAAVLRGELAPAAFLDRHVWSPLRVRVAAMQGAASKEWGGAARPSPPSGEASVSSPTQSPSGDSSEPPSASASSSDEADASSSPSAGRGRRGGGDSGGDGP
ncbi:MAG: hypothetical protein K1X88_07885 [Nannocystaceae bacterium]|nr:hypothetical protein [Nannocystaceae bacterium]